MVADWLQVVRTTWRNNGVDEAFATLLIAVVRGLLLDRLGTADRRRTDDAFERFVALLGA